MPAVKKTNSLALMIFIYIVTQILEKNYRNCELQVNDACVKVCGR